MSVLSKTVLLLNKYYLALQVTTVDSAIGALAKGKAQVVTENYRTYDIYEWNEWCRENKSELSKYEGLVRSPSLYLFAPQVIRVPDCEYHTNIVKTVKYSRRNVFQRDNHKCVYCENKRPEMIDNCRGDKALTLDHVIPRSKGGKSSWSNIVTACKWCNADKGDKLLEEIGWTLHTKPVQPKWRSHVGTPFNRIKKKYWENFLN